jgi:hypothetical protein
MDAVASDLTDRILLIDQRDTDPRSKVLSFKAPVNLSRSGSTFPECLKFLPMISIDHTIVNIWPQWNCLRTEMREMLSIVKLLFRAI